MKLFREETGDKNRDLIQYVSCGTRSGPRDQTNKEILLSLRTFTDLKSFTIGNPAYKPNTLRYKHLNTDFKELRRLYNLWKQVAHSMLRLGDELASVIFTSKLMEVRVVNDDFQEIEIRESRELEMDMRTGKFATTTSSVISELWKK
jgi:hypothetical protein